jgi:hypothetical protein
MEGQTKHDLATVLEAVDKGITVTGTANVLKVSRNTVLAYRKRWKAVDDAILSKRRELVDLSEMALRGAVLRGEPWAVTFALKTLGKDDGFTERTELTGKDGGPVSVKHERPDLSKLTDEELAELDRLAQRAAGDPNGTSAPQPE